MSQRSPVVASRPQHVSNRNKVVLAALEREKKDDNHNKLERTNSRQQAKQFVSWYHKLVDNERDNLGLYFAEDAVLQWFGRTIRTRKKISGFLRCDMHCSRHDFTAVDVCPAFVVRGEKIQRNRYDSDDMELAIPLTAPNETPATKLNKTLTRLSVRGSSCKKYPPRSGLRSASASPEWETRPTLKHSLDGDGGGVTESAKKRLKINADLMDVDVLVAHPSKSDSQRRQLVASRQGIRLQHRRQLQFETDTQSSRFDIDDKGDNAINTDSPGQTTPIKKTPPNLERGQGDCMPTTSGTNSLNISQSSVLAQLPRKYIEARGFIEFTRTRNKRGADLMRWERQCKVQVAYTDDQINAGEYIIWAVVYSDNNKCRRNLLAAFEEVARNSVKADTDGLLAVEQSPRG